MILMETCNGALYSEKDDIKYPPVVLQGGYSYFFFGGFYQNT